MQPVPAKRTDTASETSGGVLLDAGLCLDASFKPLKGEFQTSSPFRILQLSMQM